eukprot:Phypoly_transcript_05686.p1 GENE.Phypoly_transcript_05686~~Phypoly_transcript_05686.p1  ORF type:complete len:574 (+),score=146.41 Phypoly_transcript_05686:102-1823(+)
MDGNTAIDETNNLLQRLNFPGVNPFNFNSSPVSNEDDVQTRLRMPVVTSADVDHMVKYSGEMLKELDKKHEENTAKMEKVKLELEASVKEKLEVEKQLKILTKELEDNTKILESKLVELEAIKKQLQDLEAQLEKENATFLEQTRIEAELSNKCQELENQEKQLREQIASLEEQVKSLESQKNEAVLKDQALTIRQNQLATQIQRVEREIAKLEHDLNEAQNLQNSLETEIETKENEIADLSAQINLQQEEKKYQDEQEQANLNNQQNELAAAQALEREMENLDKEHQKLSEQLAACQDYTRTEKRRCSKHTVTVSREPERQRLQQQMSQNRQKHQQLTARRDRHVHKAEDFANKAHYCNERSREAAGKISLAQMQRDRASQILATKKAKHAATVNRARSLESQLGEKNKAHDVYLRQQENLGADKDALNLEINRMSASIAAKAAQHTQTSGSLKQVQASYAIEKRKKEVIEEEVKKTRENIEKKNGDIFNHRKEIDDLKTNISVISYKVEAAQRNKQKLTEAAETLQQQFRNLTQEKASIYEQRTRLQAMQNGAKKEQERRNPNPLRHSGRI